MVTFSTTPTARYPPPSLKPGTGPADIVLECDGQTFEAHKSVVCPQSQTLQDACDAAAKGAPVGINADAYNVPTIRRLLDYLYHGEYDVGRAQQSTTGDDDDKLTIFDVLAHVCCYTIGQHYQVEGLCTQALNDFSESLCVVSPDEFAEVMSRTATYTEEKPVHKALRSVAASRQGELADCKSFTKTLGCEHITVPATQYLDEACNLRAAKQLAVHGAKLFRIANHSTAVANVEKTKLVKAYQAALQKNEQLRSQVDRDSSTLVLDEQVHNDAKDALLASEAAAKQAREELLASEERASRMAQVMQKIKLELEVFRNAEHNNKLAVEKANKEAAIQRLALEERLENSKAEVVSLRTSLEACLETNQRHVANEKGMAAEIQNAIKGQEKIAVELSEVKVQRDNAVINSQGASRGTNRVKDEFFASQKNLARVKQERDEAEMSLEKAKQDHDCTSASLFLATRKLTQAQQERDQARAERDQVIAEQSAAAQTFEQASQELVNQFNQVVADNVALGKIKEERDQALEEHKRTVSKLEKADQESARLRSQRNEARAENTNLRTQAREVHTAMSEGAKMLRVSNQHNDAMAQQAAETASLRSEVNQVRLQNFTLQRSIYDLQFVILNNAENRQQLLEYGGGANFAAQ